MTEDDARKISGYLARKIKNEGLIGKTNLALYTIDKIIYDEIKDLFKYDGNTRCS